MRPQLLFPSLGRQSGKRIPVLLAPQRAREKRARLQVRTRAAPRRSEAPRPGAASSSLRPFARDRRPPCARRCAPAQQHSAPPPTADFFISA